MRRKAILMAPLALLLFLLPNGKAADQDSPLEIGDRLELFVDDYLIESVNGLRQLLHSPQSAGKVLSFDQPWEGNTSLYVTVFQDDDRCRMYYRGSSHNDYVIKQAVRPDEALVPQHEQVTCYAESRDGIHWTKPSLGLVEFKGSRNNSVVWTGTSGHCFAPFKDSRPGAPPSERYKAFDTGTWNKRSALYALKSADGLHWEKMREEPVITDGAFDSQNVAFWDDIRGRYVAIYRDFTGGVRTIKCATSPDFLNWTPGVWADYGEAPPEHLYTNATIPYFRAAHIYVAFPKRFHPFRSSPHFEWQSGTARPGLSDTVFMSSRDGVHWKRYVEAFIRPGRDARNWIHRTNAVSRGLIVTGSDEMSLYVARHYTYPSAHLERMVLRTDGFVSIHADGQQGELVTKSLVFKGKELFLNYSTSASGSLRVEIQDSNGRAFPGFSLEDSPVIFGDEISAPVKWRRVRGETDRNPLASLAGRPVRLRFVLKDADLYSLRFGTGPEKN